MSKIGDQEKATGMRSYSVTNIGLTLSHVARNYPDKIAFIFDGSERSYREAARRSDRLGHALRAVGVAPRDRVALYMHNCPEVLEAMFAVWKIGAIVVPLDCTYTRDELEYHLTDCAARIVITDDARVETIAKIRSRLNLHVIVNGVDEKDLGDARLEAVLNTTDEPLLAAEVFPSDVAWLAYTSGTTGRPKGAMLSHRALAYQALTTLADVQRLETEHVTMHAAPLTHGSGYNSLAYTMKGCTQVFHQPWGFNAGLFLEQVERYRVAALFLVPTQIKMIVDHPDVRTRDLSSLQWIMYGGAPMYREHQKAALEALGPVIVQIFAQTESPMSGTVLRREEHSLIDNPKSVSVGRARVGIEVCVLDEEDNEVAAGEAGEICVRGDTVMNGYWERPEATRETLRKGWLHTGDVGMIDEAGYLHVFDRLKDMIISGGLNVYPHEIEDVLAMHPDVGEVCVVGVPDEKWGEAVHAVVVLKPGGTLTLEDIRAFTLDRLAGFKRPKSVEFVSALPKTSYGKVAKREVRDRFWQGMDRAL